MNIFSLSTSLCNPLLHWHRAWHVMSFGQWNISQRITSRSIKGPVLWGLCSLSLSLQGTLLLPHKQAWLAYWKMKPRGTDIRHPSWGPRAARPQCPTSRLKLHKWSSWGQKNCSAESSSPFWSADKTVVSSSYLRRWPMQAADQDDRIWALGSFLVYLIPLLVTELSLHCVR